LVVTVFTIFLFNKSGRTRKDENISRMDPRNFELFKTVAAGHLPQSILYKCGKKCGKGVFSIFVFWNEGLWWATLTSSTRMEG
jgi:hypothetical protein